MRPTAASERRADEAPTPFRGAGARARAQQLARVARVAAHDAGGGAGGARAPQPAAAEQQRGRATWASAEEQRAARLVQAAQRRFSVKAYEVPKQREARYRAEHPELAALADDFDAEEAARREARARAASPAPASPRAAGGRPILHLVNLPKRSPPSGSSAGYDDEAVPAGGRANLRSRWQIGFGADAPEAAGEAPPRLRRAYSAPRLHPNISRRDYVVPGMRASYEAERAPPWLENQSRGEARPRATTRNATGSPRRTTRRCRTPQRAAAACSHAAQFVRDVRALRLRRAAAKGRGAPRPLHRLGVRVGGGGAQGEGEFRPPVRRGSVNLERDGEARLARVVGRAGHRPRALERRRQRRAEPKGARRVLAAAAPRRALRVAARVIRTICHCARVVPQKNTSTARAHRSRGHSE